MYDPDYSVYLYGLYNTDLPHSLRHRSLLRNTSTELDHYLTISSQLISFRLFYNTRFLFPWFTVSHKPLDILVMNLHLQSP